MTPERTFALKLKAREEGFMLSQATKRLAELFRGAVGPCGIQHRWNGPNRGRLFFHDYLSGSTKLLVEFQRSLTAFYVDRLLAELKRLRNQAKSKGAKAA